MENPSTQHKVTKRQYTFMCEDEIIEKLRAIAAYEKEQTMFDVTISDLIRRALVETLKKYNM